MRQLDTGLIQSVSGGYIWSNAAYQTINLTNRPYSTAEICMINIVGCFGGRNSKLQISSSLHTFFA